MRPGETFEEAEKRYAKDAERFKEKYGIYPKWIWRGFWLCAVIFVIWLSS